MPNSFEKFIVGNAEAEISRLLLSRVEWPSPPADPILSSFDGKGLAVSTIEARQKLRDKVPEWYSLTSLVYPSALCAEQCSSSVTARYKASLAGRILGDEPGKIADLTGGLGIDSWAFSSVASEVLYNERDSALASAAKHNFAELEARNIRVENSEVVKGSLGGLLAGFVPDLIFLDPARRDNSGGKVFLLEDCSPNVLDLIPELFRYSRNILLKLSPMADITMAVERLNRSYEAALMEGGSEGWNGNWVREVHVVASGGECKELLVWMDREWKGEYSVTCREDGGSLSFSSEEIRSSKAVLPEAVDFKYIFEPGKSLAKAGVFNALCSRFGLIKLARSTNLFSPAPAAKGAWAPCASRPIRENQRQTERSETCFTSEVRRRKPKVNVRPGALPPEPPSVIPGAPSVILSEAKDLCEAKDLFNFGKIFEVTEVVRMNKAGMRDVGKRYPRSEVSARNIPLTSAELRARLGVRSGDDAHIFGVRIETPFQADNFLLVCHRI